VQRVLGIDGTDVRHSRGEPLRQVRRCDAGGGIEANGGLIGQHDRWGRAAVRVIVTLSRFAHCRGRPAS